MAAKLLALLINLFPVMRDEQGSGVKKVLIEHIENESMVCCGIKPLDHLHIIVWFFTTVRQDPRGHHDIHFRQPITCEIHLMKPAVTVPLIALPRVFNEFRLLVQANIIKTTKTLVQHLLKASIPTTHIEHRDTIEIQQIGDHLKSGLLGLFADPPLDLAAIAPSLLDTRGVVVPDLIFFNKIH